MIAALSLLPAEDMVRTGVSGYLEHVLAYACTAALFGLGHARFGMLRIGSLMVAYAGVLEILQVWSPGRHAELAGWAASSTGVILGLLALHVCLTRTILRKAVCA